MKEQWTTTVESVRDVVEKAALQGRDAAAELNKYGALCTESRQTQLGVALLQRLATEIEEQPIQAFLTKGEFGMTDFKRGIVTWLRRQADEAAGKPLPKPAEPPKRVRTKK